MFEYNFRVEKAIIDNPSFSKSQLLVRCYVSLSSEFNSLRENLISLSFLDERVVFI